MNDLYYLVILLACLASTLGLIRMCAWLMPRERGTSSQTGSKP
jgi:hypothetical protein